MIGLLCVLVVLIAAGLLYWLDGDYDADLQDWQRQRDTKRLRTSVRSADRTVDAEFLAAKRAMNEAAGQSWRNMIERDRG